MRIPHVLGKRRSNDKCSICSHIECCENLYVLVSPYSELSIQDNQKNNLKLSKKLGFDGMLVLNPKELPLCHKYYSPSAEDVSWAQEMEELAEEAVREGKGVAVKDNKFIGPPMLKMAQDVLAKWRMINGERKKQQNESHGLE